MTVNALPRYRKLGGILGPVLLGCYILAAVAFQQPIQALLLVSPLSVMFAAIFILHYLDQNKVAYKIENDGIRLIRSKNTRKFIRFDSIRSIKNQSGVLILSKKGWFSSSILLHPENHINEFAAELDKKLAESRNS